MRPPLPIDKVLPQIVAELRGGSSVVLRSPTGTGKTTRVPTALLDAGLGDGRLILMLEPRRIAAQTAARRMSSERGERVGGAIGYQIRFDRQATAATRVLVITEGVLLRMLADDPLLEQIGVVIFDEFHERSLTSDLGLAIVRRLQAEFRTELRIMVMSATLDPQPIADYLGGSVVTCDEGSFPVDIRYHRPNTLRPTSEDAARGVERLLLETSGDLLVFLPGVGEIRRTKAQLEVLADQKGLAIFELYGELPMDQQEAALRRADKQKIILATNVAETSVTVEGVAAVVDTGLARILRCDRAVGINRLGIERISRESADQRTGRAGRTGPGICLRLWSEQEHQHLPERESPEIFRLDLAGPLLTLMHWGENDVRRFPWFEAPPDAAVEQAERLLRRIGAIDANGITDLGKRLAMLPIHPRLGRLLIEGLRFGCVQRAALAAALLTERDPFVRERSSKTEFTSSSDVLDRIHAIEDFSHKNLRDSAVGSLRPDAARHVLRVAEQLQRTLRESGWKVSAKSSDDGPSFLRALVAAFPDRVARRREPGSSRGVLVGGRGVRLAENSAVRDSDLFVCVELEQVNSADALVRQASHVERSWLAEDWLSDSVDVEFDDVRERVVSVRRIRYDDLVLEERQAESADREQVSRMLADAAAKNLERAISLDDENVAQFVARVRSLRQWLPDLNLPEFGGDDMRSMLPQLCAGRKSFEELRSAPLLAYLQAALTPIQRMAVEREAPEYLVAASGSRIRLRYEPGRPPIMAVRIQEMFGRAETPRIAGGRITVLLHLLAPNMRAQQITDDLAGFWERTYPIVRKELRRRYPKHAWPDDPTHATAERRPKR